MLLILILIVHCLSVVIGKTFCPEPVINGEYVSDIYSPEFPLVRPPGPYTCLYHLKSPKYTNSRVEITFNDFLSICSIDEPDCDNKDLLKIYDGANSSFPLLGEFMLASNKRPPALLSSDNEMFVEYIVVSIHNNFEFSAFKAIFVFIPTNIVKLPTNVQTFPIFKKEEELINFQIEIVKGINDVLWLIKLQETNVILNLNISFNISSYIQTNILLVRDGFASTSTTVQLIELTSAIHYTTLNFTSTNRTLYIRLFSGSSKSFDGLNDVVFSIYTYNEEEKCQDIECGNKGTCQVSPVYPIGKLYCECYDGYYHTGSECKKSEKQRCQEITCVNGGTCQLSQSSLICQCPDGFVGDRCQIRNGCYDSFCANGGTCLDTIHATPFCICTHEYNGNNCENYIGYIDEPVVINECPPNYCFNGGTCFHSHDEFYCACPPLYSGKFCFQKDIEESNSKLKYLLTLLIPVIFYIVIYFICKFKKTRPDNHSNQNSHRRNRHSNQNSHRTNTLNVDHLPTYEQATTSWQQFSINDPPPKYEDVIIVREINFNTENTPSQNLENRSRQREEQTRMHSGPNLT